MNVISETCRNQPSLAIELVLSGTFIGFDECSNSLCSFPTPAPHHFRCGFIYGEGELVLRACLGLIFLPEYFPAAATSGLQVWSPGFAMARRVHPFSFSDDVLDCLARVIGVVVLLQDERTTMVECGTKNEVIFENFPMYSNGYVIFNKYERRNS